MALPSANNEVENLVTSNAKNRITNCNPVFYFLKLLFSKLHHFNFFLQVEFVLVFVVENVL